MTLTKRQRELLEEIYGHYVGTNEFPDRQSFRDNHDADDLEHLNKLEFNFSYIKNDGGRYKFDFTLFLASPLGKKELKLAFEIAIICQSLYSEYRQKPIFFTEFQKLTSHSEPQVRRALGYLSDRNFLHFGTRELHEIVALQETIRTIKTKGDIVPPYAKSRWEEDTGKKVRTPSDNNMFSSGSILPGLGGLVSPPQVVENALKIEWMENAALKRILNQNHLEANLSAKAGAYKSALIMASACIEGLLLGALEKENASSPNSENKIVDVLKRKAKSKGRESIALMELDLRQLISMAESINLIHSQHKKLSDVAAEYRNYVHPGKEARSAEIKFDEPEFASTMATLRMIMRDLNQHFLGPEAKGSGASSRRPFSGRWGKDGFSSSR